MNCGDKSLPALSTTPTTSTKEESGQMNRKALFELVHSTHQHKNQRHDLHFLWYIQKPSQTKAITNKSHQQQCAKLIKQLAHP